MITKNAPLVADKAAQRSISVTVSNNTDLTLRLEHANTTSSFSTPPPATIAPNSKGRFEVENIVQGAGCDYDVVYATSLGDDPHQLTFMGWNPWIGHAKYTETVRWPLTAESSGGQGNNAERAILIKQHR